LWSNGNLADDMGGIVVNVIMASNSVAQFSKMKNQLSSVVITSLSPSLSQ